MDRLAAASGASSVRLLLVEERDEVGAALEAGLAGGAWHLERCRTLAQAWRALQAGRFDAVLLGARALRHRGAAWVERARERGLIARDVPVWVLADPADAGAVAGRLRAASSQPASGRPSALLRRARELDAWSASLRQRRDRIFQRGAVDVPADQHADFDAEVAMFLQAQTRLRVAERAWRAHAQRQQRRLH